MLLLHKGKQVDYNVRFEAKLFENLIDRKQLAVKLGVSPALISKLMVVEGLPYIKIGRAVRYDLREVMVFLNKRKRP